MEISSWRLWESCYSRQQLHILGEETGLGKAHYVPNATFLKHKLLSSFLQRGWKRKIDQSIVIPTTLCTSLVSWDQPSIPVLGQKPVLLDLASWRIASAPKSSCTIPCCSLLTLPAHGNKPFPKLYWEAHWSTPTILKFIILMRLAAANQRKGAALIIFWPFVFLISKYLPWF